MSRTVDWEIPGEIQPKPGDCAFDLDRALGAVLGLRAMIPEDAFTAGTLGTERAGSGVLIRRDGLVLTIGYLVTEAETEEHTSELQSRSDLVCRLLLEKKKKKTTKYLT